jgi:hypothetical protein
MLGFTEERGLITLGWVSVGFHLLFLFFLPLFYYYFVVERMDGVDIGVGRWCVRWECAGRRSRRIPAYEASSCQVSHLRSGVRGVWVTR